MTRFQLPLREISSGGAGVENPRCNGKAGGTR